MKLILNRTKSNPSCTMGELTSEDGKLHLYTMEARLPADRESYITFLLPPRTYKMNIELGAVNYKDKVVRGYWPVFKKVPWFPRASFVTGTMCSARMGRIKLGTEVVDDYHIGGDDVACQQLIKWAKSIFDDIEDAEFQLEIQQDEDALITSDVSWEDYQKQLKAEQEKAEQEEIEKEIFGD